MTTFGEVSWEEDVQGIGNSKQTNNKDTWLRLEEGSNEMRLVTQPYQFLVHRYKKEGDPGYGQKINCSSIHKSCPVCDLGDKVKPRWLLGVISRKTGTYKILDVSFAVFSQIRKLARNTQRWGDPTKYDIDIVVDKNGGATGYYSVQPISKEPLSAADQKIKDDADLDDLKKRVTPPTPDQVQKRLDKLNGDTPTVAPQSSNKKAASAPSKPSPKVQQVVMEDDDESFPDYNG